MALLLTFSGCANRYRIPDSKPAPSQPYAGTVLVAPTMVAPWDDVSAPLKPNFALTGDQALAKVLPTTEAISEQVLSSFGASLAVGLPTTAVSSKKIVGGDAPGTVTTTTKEPGTAPTLTSALPSGASLPAGSSSTPTIGLDPSLQYKAANYLLQQVQLLNMEVDNATRRSCSVAYVVKLKLGVMNYRPRLPYSVHVHIGFSFNGNLPSFTMPASPPGLPPTASADLSPQCRDVPLNPSVVPLLVADDVQVALKSRAAEAATQIALALSGLVGGVGIAGNANSLQQSLTAITNHDLTSTLTVGRESESSVYALISPNNQASDQASLVSQTYDVALLLLVPRSYFGSAVDPQSSTIAVSSYSEYRDAKTGKILPDTSAGELAAAADQVLSPYLSPDGQTAWRKLDRKAKAAEATWLVRPIEEASPSLFYQRLQCKPDPDRRSSFVSQLCVTENGAQRSLIDGLPPVMWTRIGTLLNYTRDKLSLFQSPLPAPISVPQQQVLLSDDGKNPIQAVLGAVRGRSVSRLAASMRVTPFDTKAWASLPAVDVPAQTLALDTSAHTLTLTFPSLKKMNISCLSPSVVPAKPTSKAPAAGKKPADPDCPVRLAGTGSDVRPNAIFLSLDGCNQGSELCPGLTDTVITERRALEIKSSQATVMRALLKGLGDKINTELTELAKNPAKLASPAGQREHDDWTAAAADSKARLDRLDAAITALTGLKDALTAEDSARDAVVAAKPAEKAAKQATLDTAASDTAQRRDKVDDAARAAGLESYVRDYAMLGVNFAPGDETTTPSKVALSNFGPTVGFDPTTRKGDLVVTITPTPGSSTMTASISGASLMSISDQTGVTVTPDAKLGFVLPQAGVYTFHLSGLKTGVPVVLSVQALKGTKTDGDALTKRFFPAAGALGGKNGAADQSSN